MERVLMAMASDRRKRGRMLAMTHEDGTEVLVGFAFEKRARIWDRVVLVLLELECNPFEISFCLRSVDSFPDGVLI